MRVGCFVCNQVTSPCDEAGVLAIIGDVHSVIHTQPVGLRSVLALLARVSDSDLIFCADLTLQVKAGDSKLHYQHHIPAAASSLR